MITMDAENGHPYTWIFSIPHKLGFVSKDKVLIDDVDFGKIKFLKEKYNTSLEKKIN